MSDEGAGLWIILSDFLKASFGVDVFGTGVVFIGVDEEGIGEGVDLCVVEVDEGFKSWSSKAFG